MEFTIRLQKLLDYYDLSASGFAAKIGVQRSSMSHILSGRNKPSLDFTMKVLHTFEEVSIEWLIDGKGTFPKSSAITVPPTPNNKNELDEYLKKDSDENKALAVEEQKLTSEENINNNNIAKIVFFYKDGSFSVFKNTP